MLLRDLRALVVNHVDVSQKAQSHLVLLCALRALVVNHVDVSQVAGSEIPHENLKF